MNSIPADFLHLLVIGLLLMMAGCGGGGGSATSETAFQDSVAPVITLNGDLQILLQEGVEYSEAGASAMDNVDGSLTVTISGSVGTAPGVYTLTYSAADSSGNIASITRTVTVEAMSSNISGPDSPLTYPGYILIWSDEFEGAELSQLDWNFETGIGNDGWGNNELQYYRSQNATLEEGLLIIEARAEDYAGQQYTSARLTTEDKFAFQYGRVDIRAVLPEGQGLWPALWALGSNIRSVGWPASGEIDMMEMIGGSGRENTVYGTAHWSDGGNHVSYGGSKSLADGDTLANGFHVFSLVWTETALEWYIDDNLYHSMTIDDSLDLAAFRQPFFLIFNVAVGGNWPGPPNINTKFPQRMGVDYVRVFQPAD